MTVGSRAAAAVAGGPGVGAGALAGRRGARRPRRRQAIDPPPAPTVWMSTVGSRIGRPPTSRSVDRSACPPAIRQTSVEVPPMSKEIALSKPAQRGDAAPRRRRRRPGPETRIHDGCAAASSSVATPPEERMTSGSGSPASAQRRRAPAGSGRHRARGRRRPRSSTPARTRGTPARPRARRRRARPGSRRRSSSATARSWVGSRKENRRQTATASASSSGSDRGRAARARRRARSARCTPKQRSSGTSGSGCCVAEPVEVRAGLAAQMEEVLEARRRDERRPRALPLEQRVRRDRRPVREALDVVRRPTARAAATTDSSCCARGRHLGRASRSPSSRRTASVKVPPTSMPRIATAGTRTLRLLAERRSGRGTRTDAAARPRACGRARAGGRDGEPRRSNMVAGQASPELPQCSLSPARPAIPVLDYDFGEADGAVRNHFGVACVRRQRDTARSSAGGIVVAEHRRPRQRQRHEELFFVASGRASLTVATERRSTRLPERSSTSRTRRSRRGAAPWKRARRLIAVGGEPGEPFEVIRVGARVHRWLSRGAASSRSSAPAASRSTSGGRSSRTASSTCRRCGSTRRRARSRSPCRSPRARPRTSRIAEGRPGRAPRSRSGPRAGARGDAERPRGRCGYVLRLDEDLSPFYAVAAADPDLAWAAPGAGRHGPQPDRLRGGREDDLHDELRVVGDRAHGRARSSSTSASPPRAPADGRRPRLPDARGDGGRRRGLLPRRRARRLPRRATSARSRPASPRARSTSRRSAGDPDELPDDEVGAGCSTLPGVGPYAAAHIMMLLGRYSRLILDSWTRPKYAA